MIMIATVYLIVVIYEELVFLPISKMTFTKIISFDIGCA